MFNIIKYFLTLFLINVQDKKLLLPPLHLDRIYYSENINNVNNTDYVYINNKKIKNMYDILHKLKFIYYK
jgi:hypothetical protein